MNAPIPCKLCETEPRLVPPVCGHHQVCCNQCGIEVTRLSKQDAISIWNDLMKPDMTDFDREVELWNKAGRPPP